MKALKLEIYQESACYKKPFALKVAETYPLPPYSTVKGFLHKLIGAEEFVPMSISVQGNFESIFFNLQSMYSYKVEKNEEIATSVPTYIHYLYNINLIIHVLAKQNVLDDIRNGINGSTEYLSLGRREDLAVVKSVKEVNISEVSMCEGGEDPYILKHDVYIPKSQLPNDVNGINYKLNWKYKKQNGLRIWEQAYDVVYVEKDCLIDNTKALLDEDKDIVFFNDMEI